VLILDDIMEANALMKDLEPTTPQEYILKGVVNAALGQEQGIVSHFALSVIQVCLMFRSVLYKEVN